MNAEDNLRKTHKKKKIFSWHINLPDGRNLREVYKRGDVARAPSPSPSPFKGEGWDGGRTYADHNAKRDGTIASIAECGGLRSHYPHPNPPPAREREYKGLTDRKFLCT